MIRRFWRWLTRRKPQPAETLAAIDEIMRPDRILSPEEADELLEMIDETEWGAR